MQEHERQLTSIDRNLVKDIGMVAMQGLSRWTDAGGVVVPLLDGVESAGSGGDRAANGEAALLLDDQRRRPFL